MRPANGQSPAANRQRLPPPDARVRLLAILRASLGILILLPLLALFPPMPPSLERAEGREQPALAPESPASRPPSVPPTGGEGRPTGGKGGHADWWTAVQEDLRRREYYVTWQESPLFPGGLASSAGLSAGGYQAPNRAQNLRIGFYPTGIHVVPRTPTQPSPWQGEGEGGGWTWVLALTGFGRGEPPQRLPEATPIPQANRVEYRRGPITEWYVNDGHGLEQGLRISKPKPPIPNLQSPIVLGLTLTGDLTPHLTDDPSTSSGQGNQAIQLTTADGTPILRYGPPRATDATGYSLPAQMSLTPPPPDAACNTQDVSHSTHYALHITIDDATATYPITLHLTITALPPSADGSTELAEVWIGESNQDNAHLGHALSTAGDVNGDGHGDLAIGATGYDHEHTDEGGAFVYHGSPGSPAASSTWSATSKQAGALLGWSVSTAGDVNGDGYADVIVGAPRYDHGQAEEGVAFLYAGGPDGPATSPAWMGESDQEWAWFGYAVATAGDVNNDGYNDVIVGAPRYDGEQRDEGAAFVYDGGPTGIVITTTWTIHPTDQADARFGTAVSTAGDVNGDGFADVLITANGYDAEQTNEGAAFVYDGGPTGLVTATTWIVHPIDQAYANFGRSASTAGDVNGDGYSDVIVGAPWYDDPLIGEADDKIYDGTALVYHGSAAGLSPNPDWTVPDVFENAELGIAVSTAGDVNNDGYSDVIVGAYRYDGEQSHEGAAFVYHGSSTGLTTGSADWPATGDQEEAKFGLAVSAAGDVNGDGYGDIVVGAPNYTDGQSHEGVADVYYGGLDGLAATPAWSAQGNQEGAGFGFTVSTAGDVNGDGYSDLIIGAPTYNDTQADEGGAFVYLGNGGGSLPVLCPRQLRSDGSAPIAPLGRSDSPNQVRLQLTARSPLGRGVVALQWQLAPLGTPFTATTAISGTSPAWSDVLTTGVVLSQTVDGLTGNTVYRWRVRLLYRPGNRLGQTSSRWLHLLWNGPQEADFRTQSLLAPDQNADIFLPLVLRGPPLP